MCVPLIFALNACTCNACTQGCACGFETRASGDGRGTPGFVHTDLNIVVFIVIIIILLLLFPLRHEHTRPTPWNRFSKFARCLSPRAPALFWTQPNILTKDEESRWTILLYAVLLYGLHSTQRRYRGGYSFNRRRQVLSRHPLPTKDLYPCFFVQLWLLFWPWCFLSLAVNRRHCQTKDEWLVLYSCNVSSLIVSA